VANQTSPEIETGFDLEATMRDGTVLRADSYRPASGCPWPVLLARTPYGKQDPGVLARLDPLHVAGRGYLVVIQDCRGRFRSDGQWAPLTHEAADGYDTIEWAARLPGSDGRVGMYGPSYLGYTQRAALSARPPHLCAAVPEFTWSDPHDGLITRGGAYELGLVTHWTLTLGFNVLERRHDDNPAELQRRLAELNTALDGLTSYTYWELPAGAPLRRLGLPAPMRDNPTAAHLAPPHHPAGHHACAAIPTFTVAGWFDSFLQGSLDNYVAARDAGWPAALIVGPWSHDNQTTRVGDTDFGSTTHAAAIDAEGSLLDRELDWLDLHLKPELSARVPPTSEPPVLLFVMGANRWRRLPAWPPESIDIPCYLHGGGGLSPDSPESDSPPDVFHHDPGDPVPTCGGALLLPPMFPAGPFDQQQIEKRDDVLVYTSAPLRAPLEVIGRIKVHLVAHSTAPATDWVARLCDVDTDGVSRNITDGILRTSQTHMRSRQGHAADEFLIDLWSTAHVFLPGHRIRVQITASCFPRWDRNFGDSPVSARNGAGPVVAAPGTHTAQHFVYHDAARPSRLVLPTVQAAADPFRSSRPAS
jgi:putative CocE/NonD family hydrolase